ncbi:universal stress protein [Ramlibacter sp.]|uniref:universal stress protein n=1 Tax=Ramlibacter sp. TaxID=1917967 RepID=UPI002BA49770|nr:universal stress protein [Ramlibacter sp.]HWI81180.1 universal stress protein [Ramlibacter sp.]
MKESLTQLLVHLDASPHASRRLEVARAIAQTHGAAVTALYAVTPALLVVPFAPEAGPSVAAALGEIDAERRARARAVFDRAPAVPGVHAAWAEVEDYPIVPAFVRQALYADLLVLGQYDPEDSESAGVPFDFPELVMAGSGKPALVLPYAGAMPSVGQTIVIAWKPTREAARAVSAAVPLLQRARRVHVVSWGEASEGVVGAKLGLDDYLKLRGVEAVWHREGGPEPSALGDLLLSRAFDLDADLLVMGCYGHGRAREWVLGGTSRTILRSMTLPVLMAH